MTNVRNSPLRVNRLTVVQDTELDDALSEADNLSTDLFKLRAKATLALGRLSGKRAGEIAMLPRKNINVVGSNLNVDWILEKKRTKIALNKVSHKAYPLNDILTKHVINWLDFLDKKYPECQYFLPSAVKMSLALTLFTQTSMYLQKQFSTLLEDALSQYGRTYLEKQKALTSFQPTILLQPFMKFKKPLTLTQQEALKLPLVMLDVMAEGLKSVNLNPLFLNDTLSNMYL